jgi:hypothetical protein
VTNTWMTLPSMPMPRHGVAGAVIGNRFHLVSGMVQSAGVLTFLDPKLETHTGNHDILELQFNPNPPEAAKSDENPPAAAKSAAIVNSTVAPAGATSTVALTAAKFVAAPTAANSTGTASSAVRRSFTPATT